MNSWDKELLDRRRYADVLDRILKRATETPHLFQSAPVYAELTLIWTLRNQDLVISSLLKNIRSDSFQMSPQNLIKIKTDKVRDIYQANWPERVLLMVMAQILQEKTDFLVGPHVYSFRKGRGPYTALNALGSFIKKSRKKDPGLPVIVLKRDIKKYGDTIPQDKLFAQVLALTDLDKDSHFYSLLKQSIRIVYAPRESPEIKTCLRLGIPSGSPLVPPLENFYLTPLDAALSSIPDLFYGRYGDDFVCASNSDASIQRARIEMDRVVAELGLKTKIEKQMDLVLSPQNDSGLTWLGSCVNLKGVLGMKRAHLKEIRRYLRSKARDLIIRVGNFDLEPDVKVKILGRGINTLLNPKIQSRTLRLVNNQDNMQIIKDVDRDIYRWVVGDLQQFWKIKKKHAWKIARDLKIPSLSQAKNPNKKSKRKQNTDGIRTKAS